MKTEALAKELDKEIDAINIFVQTILEKNDISFSKLVEILRQKRGEKAIVKVPCCIFKERSLGILEALAKYLKEELDLGYNEIASLLNRDNRVIWRTYSNARKKLKKKLAADKKTIWIPISVFTNRKLGLLESLTKYLKEDIEMTNYEIARALNRDNRTIWTSYSRAKKKSNE